MNIEVSVKNMKFLEAFSSVTRIKIIEMLNEKPMNVKDIAKNLNISSAIVTRHIQQLEAAEIVRCESSAGVRGMQKICYLNIDQVLLTFKKTKSKRNYSYAHSIPIGQYYSFSVYPTCGLSSESKIIGIMDDPRYFADPEHTKASVLWFGSGWVEYRIPNYLTKNQTAKNIELSLEICSEAPGYNEEWPSDIIFFINGIQIGMWTSPGDFGKRKGVFTPDWWNFGTQHGLLKTIRIDETGGYIDGIRTSEVTISDLKITYGSELVFRIANLQTSTNLGGVTLFGKGFGNYNQDINFVIEYNI